MIILGTNSIKASGFDVDNSVRLDNNAYFSRTFSETGAGSGGGTFKWTLSLWFKRSLIDGNEHVLMSRYVNANKYVTIKINGNNKIEYRVYNFANQCRMTTTAVFRDPTNWVHFVIAQDTSIGTAGDRTKFFVNGSRVTAFDTQTNFSQNVGGDFNTAAEHQLGAYNGGDEFQGYFAQVCFVDNVQYDADQFGEFDSDSPTIWKPKDVSGLSTGATSFFLDFADSGDLGDDESGETNDWTENNLAATDQTTDTCTNNFATLNPLMNNLNNLPTLSEGNLEVLAVSGSTWSVTPSTIGLPKKGKWVFEVEAVSGTSGDRAAFAGWINPAVSNPLANGSILWRNIASTNSILSNDSAATGSFSATTWGTNGHIIGMYIDMDNSKMYFTHNGTVQNSGTGIDFQGTFDDDTFILPVVMVINTDKLSVNFGNPAANFAIASGNTDPNGFGNFEFTTTITGDGSSKSFYAICSKNIAELG